MRRRRESLPRECLWLMLARGAAREHADVTLMLSPQHSKLRGKQLVRGE